MDAAGFWAAAQTKPQQSIARRIFRMAKKIPLPGDFMGVGGDFCVWMSRGRAAGKFGVLGNMARQEKPFLLLLENRDFLCLQSVSSKLARVNLAGRGWRQADRRRVRNGTKTRPKFATSLLLENGDVVCFLGDEMCADRPGLLLEKT